MPEVKISTLNNASAHHTLDYKDNTIVFSNLNYFSKPILAEGISIKFSLKGTEHYYLNHQNITLHESECFISNIPLEGQVNIESKTAVQGICVHISYDLIHEIETSLTGCEKPTVSSFAGNSSTMRSGIFNLFKLGNNLLSIKLAKIGSAFIDGKEGFLDNKEDLFFEMGETFVKEQLPFLQYNQKVQTVRDQTRIDLIKKLFWAKEYLESNCCNTLLVKDLAVIATMSEFHFSRMFKKVFGYSPHQYQTKLRLEMARDLLRKDMYNVQETAQTVGYTDVFVFSKAFKRYFGLNPSAFQISRN